MNHKILMERIERLYLTMVGLEARGYKTSGYQEIIGKYARVLSMQKDGFLNFIQKNPNSNPSKYLLGEVDKINTILGIVKDL